MSPAPLMADAPTAPVTGIGQSIYNATTELQNRKKALLATSDPASPYNQANKAASLGVLALQDPSSPLYAASLSAKRAVSSAMGQQTQQQRNYYNTAGGFIAERQGENAELTAATHDVPDLEAVAQAKIHDNAINRIRDQVGIMRPLEIDTPQGFSGSLPVGVARSRRTNAEYIDQANKEKDAARGLTLEDLRNRLDITGTNVADLRRAGDTADLNLEEARAGAGYKSKLSGFTLGNAIDEAQYGKDLGGLELEDANLKAKYSGLVPYDDPNNPSGIPEYVTPAEKDRREFAYRQGLELSRIPANYGLQVASKNYVNEVQGQGAPLAALSDPQLLNTLPNNASIWQTQPVVEELTRRFMAANPGYTQEQAAKRAFAQVEQELATRKKTSSTVFGSAPAPGSTPSPAAPSGSAPFTFGP